MTEDQIYKAAMAHYGQASQEDKLIEECAELIQAILKHRRKPCAETLDNLYEEFADVMIVMGQINHIFSPVLLAHHKQKKLSRLQKLIEVKPVIF